MEVEDAEQLNEQGHWLLDENELDAAEKVFRAATVKDPTLASAWFNLGLVYKWRQDWRQSLDCNQRAAQLSQAGEGDPAWWNLGIAATALHHWDVARRAWTAYGVSLADGTGPPVGNFGRACARINPQGNAEVVWVRRLDPARGQIESVPLPESGHRWHDIVLHDGAPNGHRVVSQSTYPVFDELERWQPSSVPTQRAQLQCDAPADAEALVRLFEKAELAAEDWTESIEPLCKQCSEGTPNPLHTHRPHEWSSARDFGLAAENDRAKELLAEWASGAARGRAVVALEGSG